MTKTNAAVDADKRAAGPAGPGAHDETGRRDAAPPAGRKRRLAAAACLALAAALLAGASAAAAPAAADVLVSNIGQTVHGTGSAIASDAAGAQAQRFTAGGNSRGYVLESIELQFATAVATPAQLRVELWSASGGDPGARLASLAVPAAVGAGAVAFAAPADTVLAANTSYFALVRATGATAGAVALTAGDDEDTGAQSGWSIGDAGHFRAAGSTAWSRPSQSMKIRVNGTAKQAPVLTFDLHTDVASETEGPVTVTVNIAPPLSAASRVAIGFGGQASPADYTVSGLASGVLALPQGAASASFTVDAVADRTTEGAPEALILTLTAIADPPYVLGDPDETELVIIDDSLTPGVSLLPWSATLTAADVSVRRGSNPMAVRKKKDGSGGYVPCSGPAGLASNETCTGGVVYERVPLSAIAGKTSFTALGCKSELQGSRCIPGEKLSHSGFVLDGVDYRVIQVSLTGGTLSFSLDRDIPESLKTATLTVGSKELSLADATGFGLTAQWGNTGLAWSVGDTVPLRLSVPGGRFMGAQAAPGPEAPARDGALTAAFERVPAEHDGKAFAFLVRFSEAPGTAGRPPRADSFAVAQGRVKSVERVEAGLWRVRIKPNSWKRDVAVTLAGGRDCGADGAVCTVHGQALANTASAAVPGPVRLKAEGGKAREGADAAVSFRVSLSRAASGTVTVGYATEDRTAAAGEDYTAASGTLAFAPGETAKTVPVAILDDAVDEGKETFVLRLSNAVGARIVDGRATGTILNEDPIPQAWLARFGRTVTGQVLDAVEARLSAPRQAGARASLAGQALPAWDGAAAGTGATGATSLAAAGDAGRPGFGASGAESGLGWQSRAVTGRDFLTGTSFALTGGSAADGGSGALWGRGAISRFDGREGDLTLDGEVSTGLVGADWASDPASGAGRWTAGLAAGHSRGQGGYRMPMESGAIEAALTGLYPYAGMDLTDRLSAWAAAGYGAGEVTVEPEGRASRKADLAMAMAAAGLRSELLRPPADGNGLSLALKSDARFTRTSSAAARGMDAAEADVWLARAGIEGSRRFALGEDGTALTPSLEIGARLDGGDAETGLGADLGGGLAFADPESGMTLDMRARGLLAHQAAGFREWGASAALAWDPRPETGRGVSMSLRQSWGASPSGGMDALLSRETLAGLAADGNGAGFEAASRLDGEIGYGLPMLDGAFTGTPNLGFGMSGSGARDWRIGWRLTPAATGASGFEANLDTILREPAGGNEVEHGAMLRATLRW